MSIMKEGLRIRGQKVAVIYGDGCLIGGSNDRLGMETSGR